MGRPKASLEWHGSTFLARVSGLLARALDGPIVVVRAPGQDLPPLAPEVEVAEDAREGGGPLEGIAAGLRAVDGRAALAFISAVDVPLLQPAFVRRVVSLLDEGMDADRPGCQRPDSPACERLSRRACYQLSKSSLSQELGGRWIFSIESRRATSTKTIFSQIGTSARAIPLSTRFGT